MSEKDPVHFNFAEGPNGTIAFGAHFVGGFDRNKRTHRFAVNVLHYLESEAVSKSCEVVNDQEVEPNTLPAQTLYDA